MVTATAALSAAVVTAPTPGLIPTRDPASLGLTSPLTPTATPIGPYAVVDGQLYAGPGTTYPPAGTVTAGQTLDILGWYTEGTW